MSDDRSKLLRYGAGNDGCFWCPEEDRPAYDTDVHYQTVPAAVIVGANVTWRLCEECAKLPRFRRFRSRRKIERKPPQ